jgi:hypothetical protein
MRVQLREFYAEVTGEPANLGATSAKRAAMTRWGVPMEHPVTKGSKVMTKVDSKYLPMAIAAYKLEQDEKARAKVKAKPAAIATEQDGVDVYAVLVEIRDLIKAHIGAL